MYSVPFFQGFNEGKGKPFVAEDIRFTTKGDTLYAIALGWPKDGKLTVKSLAKGHAYYPREINRVELLGNQQALSFERAENGLVVTLSQRATDAYTCVLKIS